MTKMTKELDALLALAQEVGSLSALYSDAVDLHARAPEGVAQVEAREQVGRKREAYEYAAACLKRAREQFLELHTSAEVAS